MHMYAASIFHITQAAYFNVMGGKFAYKWNHMPTPA